MTEQQDLKGIRAALLFTPDGALVSVGKTDNSVDPVTQKLVGSPADVLLGTLRLIYEAQTKWVSEPRAPAYKAPRARPAEKATPRASSASPSASPSPAGAPLAPVSAEGQRHPRSAIEAEGMPLKAEPAPEMVMEGPSPLDRGNTESPLGADEAPVGSGPVPAASPELSPAASLLAGLTLEEIRAITEAEEPEPEGVVVTDIVTTNVEQETVVDTPALTLAPLFVLKPKGFRVKGGDGTESATIYADVQSALDAAGVPKEGRPTHNRYDRLASKYQAMLVPVYP